MSTTEALEPEPEHRHAWLAIPGPRPGTAWADADGRLPNPAFDIAAASTTVGALQREILPGLGVGGPTLGCLLRYEDPWTPATVVSALVELEPQPPGWTPPEGWQAVDLAGPGEAEGLVDGLLNTLQPRVADWVAEQLGAPLDPFAPPWSQPGWWERTTDWIAAQLPDRGPLDVEQVRAWGISTVLRATDADGQRYWFKGICTHFGREVAVTEALHRVAPEFVAPVLAADRDEFRLLLGDLPDVAPAGEPATHASAYARLRDLQRKVEPHRSDLIAAGATVRPLADVPAAFAATMADLELPEWHGIAPARVGELVRWVEQAVIEVAALGLPDVVVHGDFHPGNVATLGDGTRVIFDWSDAAITQPFVDVPTWLTWIEDDVDEQARTWASFAQVWSDVLPADEWLARRTLLEGVAGAYHVVSYAGIVRAMDVHRKFEHARGIAEFVAFVDAAAPAGP